MTRPSPELDQFAEMLAEGHSILDAATAMGTTRKRGYRYLDDIRARLGWQAI